MPLLPLHLLWINLVTDGPPALALAADPIEHDVMRRPPQRASESISGSGFFNTVVFTGILTGGVALAVYWYQLRVSSVEVARTFAFATLVFSQPFLAPAFQSQTRLFWRLNPLTNAKLLGIILVSLSVQVMIFRSDVLSRLLKSVPIAWRDLLWLLPICVIPTLLIEVRKAFKKYRPARDWPEQS